MPKRIEYDSFGKIGVPEDRYWGAQTQRSLDNFHIGQDMIPAPLIRAFGIQKYSAAKANQILGKLDEKVASAIMQAALEVRELTLLEHFPLGVWQTGSGTQTHMNVNEVISNRAIEIMQGTMGSKHPVHPNDHVNLGQSSNDTFPTVMHIAVVEEIHQNLVPVLNAFEKNLWDKVEDWKDIVKIGRTHLQDATPLTLGQAFSGYATQIQKSLERVHAALPRLYCLPQGGTAVGTGLNTHPDFAQYCLQSINEQTGLSFHEADNKFEGMAAHDAMVEFAGVLNTMAVSVMKIANDIRLMASGPRCGIGELILPAHEPGSSIMPGKVNPTQAEALTMVCAQVMGHHSAVTIAASHGHLELNTFKPMIANCLLHSISILSDALRSFLEKSLKGLTPNKLRIQQHLDKSLMLITALTPHIGYDKATYVAKKAHQENKTLKEVVAELGLLSEELFEQEMDPFKMTHS